MRQTILRMMRRATSSKMSSATHLPTREPFLLFAPGLPGLYGLFGLYISCASSLELEHTNNYYHNNCTYLLYVLRVGVKKVAYSLSMLRA